MKRKKRTQNQCECLGNNAGIWRVTIGPKKDMDIGINFKACIIVAHNFGPGKISIEQATGASIDVASGQVILTQLEYAFKFIGAKDKPAKIEFQILPVAPWSFWRVADTPKAPAS
jgi:hypothetical protein